MANTLCPLLYRHSANALDGIPVLCLMKILLTLEKKLASLNRSVPGSLTHRCTSVDDGNAWGKRKKKKSSSLLLFACCVLAAEFLQCTTLFLEQLYSCSFPLVFQDPQQLELGVYCRCKDQVRVFKNFWEPLLDCRLKGIGKWGAVLHLWEGPLVSQERVESGLQHAHIHVLLALQDVQCLRHAIHRLKEYKRSAHCTKWNKNY